MKKEKKEDVPLRTAYSQAGRCGMQPKANNSLRAQAQLSETKTETKTCELLRGTAERTREVAPAISGGPRTGAHAQGPQQRTQEATRPHSKVSSVTLEGCYPYVQYCHTHNLLQVPIAELAESVGLNFLRSRVLDESRSFFRVHTGYFSNIPKCIKAEFIASWACSQSSVVSSSER
ncbi:hypothetical protein TNCV_3155331 [Trichonephila clavipes]|nr:hypothetical protein TNCV_3155331 [Trichonephila clavipes]